MKRFFCNICQKTRRARRLPADVTTPTLDSNGKVISYGRGTYGRGTCRRHSANREPASVTTSVKVVSVFPDTAQSKHAGSYVTDFTRFHGSPLRSTNRIPVSTARSGIGARPG